MGQACKHQDQDSDRLDQDIPSPDQHHCSDEAKWRLVGTKTKTDTVTV